MSLVDVLESRATHHVACERAEAFVDRLPDGCVSLMTLDFPYYGVKDDAWDNAWESPEAFIAWMGSILAPCRRALAPNGSIYVFTKPQSDDGGVTMATRVEREIVNHFHLLTRATWCKTLKHTPAHYKMDKSILRSYFPLSEQIFFAEQRGEDAHGAACARLRGEVFEPLRAYLDGERERAGLDRAACDAACGNQMAGHYFSAVQWALPTAANYAKLQARAPGCFGRPYEALREQYEALREQYEALRRPFSVSAAVPYTDVWHYDTVQPHDGKHPCEKPEDMARDIVRASSREGGLVADFFCGSGAFLAAAVAEGRRAIGCDMDPHWAEQAQRRCDAVKATGRVVRTAPKPKETGQMSLLK